MALNRLGLRATGAAGAFVVVAAWLAAPSASAAAQVTWGAALASSAVCPPAPAAGKLSCAVRATRLSSSIRGVQAAASPSGYGPADLQNAYGLQAATEGTRQTVAIIAAGGDPNAEADLAVYRTQYSLPACTTADGCLSIVDQNGGTNLPPVLTGEPPQIATDLDMVSATCPNCHILLVEASTASIDDLGTAVNQAVTLGARIVNISYYGPEDTTDSSWDSSYFSHPGVAIITAAGNDGYTGGPLNYPAASPDVVSVGGTVLDKAGVTGCTTAQGGARGWCEAAWQFTTSGCSQYEAKPSWQGSTGCSGRADNDLAAVAASTASPTPIAIYDSYDLGGWSVAGGTGAASPIVAGIYADAGTPGASDNPAGYPYQHPGGGYTSPGTAYPYFDGLNDTATGSTGTCSTAALCTAGPGWDGPTGLGSPASVLSLTASGTLSGQLPDDFGASNKCADNSSGNLTNGNVIQIWTCNAGPPAENWTLKSDASIHINGSTFCMDVSGSGTANKTPIVLETCNGHASQQWKVMSGGQLINKNSGTCLEDPANSTTNGTQLQIYACNGNIQQNWAAPYVVPASNGEIHSMPNPGDCVDNNHGTLANNNVVDIWTCNGGGNSQIWNVETDGTIHINGSAFCLAVSGGGTTNGTLTIAYSCIAHTDQQWIARSDGSLENLKAAICLDDPADSTTNGTQLQIWNCNTNPQQGWKLP